MSLFSSNETIKVPPSQLRELADEIRGYSDDASSAFDEVGNIVDELLIGGLWDGKSAESYKAKTAENISKFSPAADKLEEMADFLDSVADEMEAVDQKIKSQVMAI